MTDRRRIRVALVESRLSVGGAESQVIALANGLDRDRFEAHVFCTKAAGELEGLLDDPARLHVIGVRSGADPRVVKRLANGFVERCIDVVHCTNFNSTAWGRLAAFRAGIKVVVTAEHSASRDSLKERLLIPLFNRFLDSRTAAVVACADAQVPLLAAEGNDERHVRVIHNGVRLSAAGAPEGGTPGIPGLRDEHVLITIVGALRPVKNHRLFLQMAEMLQRERDDVRFLIVGDGELRGELEGWTRERGLDDVVYFAGRRADVPQLLTRSDVVCLTSRSEAFPLSVLEAMASARPVVATAVGGIPEIVIHGETGFLVRDDDAEALTAAVRELVSDPATRQTMGTAGRSRVERLFTLQKMVEAYEDLFEKLLAETRAAE